MISIRIAAVLLLALVVVTNCAKMNGKRSVSKREVKTDLQGKMTVDITQPENNLKADATQNNLKAENTQAITEAKGFLKDATQLGRERSCCEEWCERSHSHDHIHRECPCSSSNCDECSCSF